ncbi:MAG: Rieske 2Fe-2S domain-containing protein [Acidobacteria bacterium]|nr:Rieske 2Fe-2S domain-containing protein [Acidobacteriota bacterium]
MDATSIFIIGILITGALAVLGIFAVAFRRDPSAGPVTVEELDVKARQADEASRAMKAEQQAADDEVTVAAVATVVEAPPEATADPLTDQIEVTVAEYNVTRRQFFNRALLAVFGLFLLQFALASLAFIWPKLRGGFGTPVNVGNLEEIKREISVAGAVVPLFRASAQSWLVTFDLDQLEGSSFENTPFVIAGGEADGVGVMALWQKCVHLGCRVPSCVPSQGFECPCHGSKYNIHGEYEAGPAPRNLDRFGVEVNDAGDLIIQTGVIVETARSKNKTAQYPQGPFCV